jgi:phage tail sheath protein FI
MVLTVTGPFTAPGVFMSETEAFPPSVVGVATAVPIFIGYTQTARNPTNQDPLYLQAVQVASMADYIHYFGSGYDGRGLVEAASGDATPYDFTASVSDGTSARAGNYVVAATSGKDPQFNLYPSMQMFYANGGGECFVISVGDYWQTQAIVPPAEGTPGEPVKAADLLSGIAVAQDIVGGSMLVVPDACLLPATGDPLTYSDYGAVVQAMLKQANRLQDRVAILDLPGALDPAMWSPAAMQAEAENFYTQIAPAAGCFSYGAAYGPAVETTLLSAADILYTRLAGSPDSTNLVNALLTQQALDLYPAIFPVPGEPRFSDDFANIAARIGAAFPPTGSSPMPSDPAAVTGTIGTGADAMMVSLPKPSVYAAPVDDPGRSALNQYLTNALPLFEQMQQILAGKLNVVPASGIMAGIWAQNDLNRGVWNAPANISVAGAIAPVVLLTEDQQGPLNVPLNGNAIDVLRMFPGRGTVVWGARTLDGNSLDYRYIQVRRTLVYIQQSIKLALEQYVFAPNDGGTWATVTASVSNFLTQLWQAGGLMGDKASDAFSVACGVPTTMSGLDVLNGNMIVKVTLQMIHPAEYIELTFTQTMQGV